jgi:ABC-type sugar transport system permease subunit
VNFSPLGELVTNLSIFFDSLQFLAVLLIAVAMVFAMPADETVVGEFADADSYNPEDPQQIFKLKKFKKLFLG